MSWNPRRKRRRSYRRNAVLPYFAMNPIGGLLGRGGILGRVQDFLGVGFWTDTALPGLSGFLGAKVGGKMISGFVGGILKTDETTLPGKLVKIGSQAVATSVLAYFVGRFLGQKRGQAVFLGGVISVAHSVIVEVLGADSEVGKAIGLSGMGDDLTSRMREAVQRRVEAELSGDGMGSYLTRPETRLNGMGAFVTDRQMRLQPDYSALPTGDLRDYDVARSETTF